MTILPLGTFSSPYALPEQPSVGRSIPMTHGDAGDNSIAAPKDLPRYAEQFAQWIETSGNWSGDCGDIAPNLVAVLYPGVILSVDVIDTQNGTTDNICLFCEDAGEAGRFVQLTLCDQRYAAVVDGVEQHVPADGNGFFYSFLHALQGHPPSSEDVQELRNRIADHIRDHPEIVDMAGVGDEVARLDATPISSPTSTRRETVPISVTPEVRPEAPAARPEAPAAHPGAPAAPRKEVSADVAGLAHWIGETGNWNSDLGDIAPNLLPMLFPHVGISIHTVDAHTALTVKLPMLSVDGGVPSQVLEMRLGRDHYSPIIDGAVREAPADGNCFFYSFLYALNKRKPGIAEVQALRDRLAEFVLRNPSVLDWVGTRGASDLNAPSTAQAVKPANSLAGVLADVHPAFKPVAPEIIWRATAHAA